MKVRAERRRWLSRDERGAVLVEMAIVVPFLVTLLLGIIDFGSILNDGASLSQSTRVTARAAATGNFGTAAGCPQTGIPGTDPLAVSLICQVKGGLADPSEVRVAIRYPDGNGYERGDAVLICAQRSMRSVSGFVDAVVAGKTQRSSAMMRIESDDVDVAPTEVSEQSSAGWDWCTA